MTLTNHIIRENIADQVFFNRIKDDRFKTIRISATMFVPLAKETAAANALLPMLLARSCKAYPDAMSLNRKLNSLYGAAVSGYCRKMGESLAITLSVSGIDDRYTLEGETLSQQLVELLSKMLFEPKVLNGAFAQEDFSQEKRQLIDSIDSDYNEKRTYATNRCNEVMCANEAYGIARYGTKEAVQKLTPEDIYKAWLDMLKTAKVEIMLLGNNSSSEAKAAFAKGFEKLERVPAKIETQIIKDVKEIKDETELQDVAQCKLVMGFRCGAAEPLNDTMAMRLAVAVLGGTPSSKLFMNVREKYSLCYYCAARYNKNKGIVTVDSGVETENIEKARKEILHQLELLQNGDVSDFEIDSAKRSITNSFITMSDTLGGTEAWYITQMLDKELYAPNQAAQKINAVTKEQIIQAAKTIELDTIYVLKADENKKEEG